MEPSWTTALLSLVIAASTWYQRRASVKDKGEVIQKTSSPADVERVRSELHALRDEFHIFRDAYFKKNPVVNHQSPQGGE